MRKIILSAAILLAASVNSQSITGSGSGNFIPMFTGATTIGNSVIRQVLVGTNQSIGININPTSQLHVRCTNSNSDGIKIENGGTGSAIISLHRLPTGKKFELVSTGSTDASGQGNFIIRENTSTAVNRFFISGSNGFVGINTNNPTANLSVDGNMLIGSSTVPLPTGYKLYVQTGILTEKVKVALTTNPTDWADYVFDKDYKLRSLEEVEKYIVANKHLPGVPSTKELIEEGGIDLGKMDAKLMEKVEELTLYIIALKKQLDEQKAEIDILKNK